MHRLTLKKQELQRQIGELETTLASLQEKLQEETAKDQHEAIDSLEEYLDAADNKFCCIREFWKVLREVVIEIRGETKDAR